MNSISWSESDGYVVGSQNVASGMAMIKKRVNR